MVVVDEVLVSLPPAAASVPPPAAASVPVPVVVVEVVLLDVLVLVSVSGTTTVVGGALAGCWFTMVVDEPGVVVSAGRMAKK